MRDHSRETPCRARPESEWSEFRTALAVALSCNTLIDFALRTNKRAAIRTDKYRKGPPRSTDDGTWLPGKNPRDQGRACVGTRKRIQSPYFVLQSKGGRIRPAGDGVPSVTDRDSALHSGLAL